MDFIPETLINKPKVLLVYTQRMVRGRTFEMIENLGILTLAAQLNANGFEAKAYTGITTDVSRRFCQHQTGKGAKALRGKGELELAFSQAVGERSLALRLEYRIKQLTKRQKERLVAGDGSYETLLEGLRSS